MEEAEKRHHKPRKTAFLAVLTNSILTLMKFILAFLSGSLALLAEAFHSLADIGSSLAVLIAIRVESSGPSQAGSRLGRYISRNPQRKVALCIGLFLLLLSLSIFRKMFGAQSIGVRYPVPVALGMLILAMLSLWLSRLERAVGEKYDATALTADGYHARVDMVVSLFVAIVLFGESLSLRVDRIAAGVIAGFIFLQAINVFVIVFKDLRKKEEQIDYVRGMLRLSRQKYFDHVKTELKEMYGTNDLEEVKDSLFSPERYNAIKRAYSPVLDDNHNNWIPELTMERAKEFKIEYLIGKV